MPWTRDTPWRQGSILNSRNFERLGIDREEEGIVALAISHDCDITNEDLIAEPYVEFVIGRVIENADGNNTHAKNPRTLHIPMKHGEDDVFIQLMAADKIQVCKEHLLGIEPDTAWSIERGNLRVLQHWLAARYKRQSLPDALMERLRPVAGFLEKHGKKHSRSVLGYWLDYEPFVTELPTDQAYELWLYVVYTVDEDGAQKSAEQIAAALRDNFSQLIDRNGGAGKIDLRECEAYSEEEFTLRDLRGNIEYRFDFISLRPKSAGPIVE